MSEIVPYLRYIALADNFINNFYTKAYDCRLIYIIEGKCELRTETETISLSANSIGYYPCGVSYLPVSCSETIRFITVNFDFTQEYSCNKQPVPPVAVNLFNEELNQLSYRSIPYTAYSRPFAVDSVPNVLDYLMQIINLYDNDSPYAEKICSGILSAVLYSILYCMENIDRSNAIVKHVQRYIADHYSEKITNESIADALMYHPYYINTIFKQNTGETIHRYMMEFRIKKSCTLLVNTNMNVHEIAFECGFVNQTHFSTCFKKVNKITPLEYRRNFGLI